jgi:hypothetical protein
MDKSWRTCANCGRDWPPAHFARNKHNPDGSGCSSYCMSCCEDEAVWHLAEKERKLDWAYRDPAKRQLRDMNLRLAAKHKRERAERAAERTALDKPYIDERKVCIECGREKSLLDFPKNRYARPHGDAKEHSNRCWECWHKMPDYRRLLNNERSRDRAAARDKAPLDSPLGRERKRKETRDELYQEGIRLGIEPVRFRLMTHEERNAIRWQHHFGARLPDAIVQEPETVRRPDITITHGGTTTHITSDPQIVGHVIELDESDLDNIDNMAVEEMYAYLDKQLGER